MNLISSDKKNDVTLTFCVLFLTMKAGNLSIFRAGNLIK